MTSNFLFYIKKSKTLRNGNAPIYLRITVNGQRAEIGIKENISHYLWSPVKQKVSGKTSEAKQINSVLETILVTLHNYRRELIEKNEPITAEALKSRITGENKPQVTLLELFFKHNDRVKSLIGIEFALGTLKRYLTTIKHIQNFLQLNQKTDIPLTSVNHSFLSDFAHYLRVDRRCNNNSTVGNLKLLKKITTLALHQDLIQKDPFANYKMRLEKVEKEFLTEEELEILASKCFEIERLEIVKDIFLFGCYTGLAYVDIKNLSYDNINKGFNNSDVLHVQRQKSGVMSSIPILPTAKRILEKYSDHYKCLDTGKLLPIPSNQKMNGYLKEIADLCGIKKQLTTHMARHTFATTVALTNNVPIETVSKMLGHSNVIMTEHYAKVIEKKMYQDTLFIMNKYN